MHFPGVYCAPQAAGLCAFVAMVILIYTTADLFCRAKTFGKVLSWLLRHTGKSKDYMRPLVKQDIQALPHHQKISHRIVLRPKIVWHLLFDNLQAQVSEQHLKSEKQKSKKAICSGEMQDRMNAGEGMCRTA